MRRDHAGHSVSNRRRPAGAHATLVLAAGVLLSGCGALFGSRYDNFRAYYNTFYNARRSFDTGERALHRPDQRIDRTRFLPLFPATQSTGATGPAPTPTSGPFQQAIDKSADLLRERPGSRYADDALLLIGKSYFYTGNYVGAEQKFRETIDAATAARQQRLVDEARFWLGRTLAAQRRFDEGASILEAALTDPAGARDWRPRLRLALGALHADARRWDAAAASLGAAFDEGGIGDELAARAEFLRGQVLEAAGRPADAADAYGRVSRHRPPYELAYAARISRALALGLAGRQPDLALDELRSMRRDGKHFVNRAEIELAYARVLAAGGQADESGERFRAVLYDRTYEGGTVRGEALFRYAEYHRDVRSDLVRAAAYFDSAAAVARTEPGREELVTAAAITSARRTADVYGAYADLAARLTRVDSLLDLGALDDAAFQARVAQIEASRLVAWREERRRLARERAAAGFTETSVDRGMAATGLPVTRRPEDDSGEPPAAVPGVTPPPASGAASADGFLAYRNVARVQAALLAFERNWGQRPRVPDWRRRAAIGGAIATGPGLDAQTGPEDPLGLDRPPPLDLTVVPRTPETQEAMRLERAGLRYEIGNVLFLSIGEIDAAAEWYRLVIDEDVAAPVAVRALYALAELERARGRAAEAEDLYGRVLDAGADGELEAQARERLGLAATPDATAGEVAAADSAYAAGRRAWSERRYADAVEAMLLVAARYPGAPAAPRALLAAAGAYTEWAHRDSLSLAAIPDSLVPQVLRDAVPEGQTDGPRTDAQADSAATPGSPGDLVSLAEGKDEERVRDERDTTQVTAPEFRLAPSLVVGDSATVQWLDQPARGFGVVDIYAILASRYPGTPFAERALTLRAVLVGDAGPAADSVAAAPVATPTRPGGRPGAAAGGLIGDAAIDPAAGGFTWRVARVPTGLGARALLRNFQRRGFRTGATVDVTDDGSPIYNVVVGQFESIELAERARDDLPVTGLGSDLELIPVESLVLLDEQQLLAEPPTRTPSAD